jgi:hypothetical protein
MEIKPKPISFITEMVRAILDGRKTQTRCIHDKPKYAVGDVLWVREKWRFDCLDFVWGEKPRAKIVYSDSYNLFNFDSVLRAKKFEKFINKQGWQSPYFFPREAARLFLRVTRVWQERLQNITEKDARAEGVWSLGIYNDFDGHENVCVGETYREPFAILWDSINGKKAGCSWGDNPIVTAYEFERIEK